MYKTKKSEIEPIFASDTSKWSDFKTFETFLEKNSSGVNFRILVVCDEICWSRGPKFLIKDKLSPLKICIGSLSWLRKPISSNSQLEKLGFGVLKLSNGSRDIFIAKSELANWPIDFSYWMSIPGNKTFFFKLRKTLSQYRQETKIESENSCFTENILKWWKR